MIFLRIILIAIICFTLPISGKQECYAEQGEQGEQCERDKLAIKKKKQKKLKCKAWVSGFFVASSLLGLGGIITGKALSDITVDTVQPPDPLALSRVDDHTFFEYKHLNKDFDQSFNRLSSSCKKLDRGLDDILDKYQDDEDVAYEIFRNTIFDDKCHHLVSEKEGVDLPEAPYTKRQLATHLDSFAIQLITLSSVAIISTGLLVNYLNKISKVAKSIKREQKRERRRLEQEQHDEENPPPNGPLAPDKRAKVKKNHLLSLVVGSALACAANSMGSTIYPHKRDIRINTDLFNQNDEPAIYSYFNRTHERDWNDILLLSDDLKQIEEEIAKIESDFEDDSLGFGMIIASDPQLPWGKKDNGNLTDQEWIETGIETNRYHTASMNNLHKLGGDFSKVQAVIMNGDLTAYAHPWQWVLYKRLYDNRTKDSYPEVLNMPLYPGLGNHDYKNNVQACWGPWYSVLIDQKNWCAKNSKDEIKRYLADLPITNFDEGSLSYSWDNGPIHFVQLHNYPNYNETKIDIEDSIEWLEDDLTMAQADGRLIVLNFHIKKYSPELKKIFKKFNIIGLFVGHYHQLVGRKSKLETALGDSSVYYSGSASHNLYNYVYFSEHKMVVYSIDSSNGKPVIRERYTQVYS